MRVTFVAGRIGSLGGVSRVIMSQARYLARKGHRVTLVAPTSPRIGHGVYQVAMPPTANPIVRVARTSGMIAETRPDIVLAHVGMRDIASALSGRLAHRLVIYSHGGPYTVSSDLSRPSLRERFYSSGAISVAYHAANLVITNSRWCSEAFAQNGIEAEVVYPGVDSGFFTPLDSSTSRKLIGMERYGSAAFTKRPIFITVGFGAWKGNTLLVDALQKVKRTYPRVLVTFVGRYQSPHTLTHAKKRGVASNVMFLQDIDENTLHLWLSAATAYVHMYGLEHFGLPIAEAQSCGTPAIGPNSGGAAEIIEDHKTGLLFSDGDPEALAQQMLYAIEHASEMDAMRLAARRRVIENFDVAVVNEQLEGLLTGILCHAS